MNGHDELLDRLRELNPAPVSGVADVQFESADDVLRRVTTRRPRPRRTVVVALMIALVLMIAALATAFVVLRTSKPRSVGDVACYAAADVNGPRVLTVGDSPAKCATLWRAGRLGAGPVPSFAMCVLPQGGLGAFPGEADTTCQRLRLATARGEDDAVARMSLAVADELQPSCVDEQRARTVIADALQREGLNGWTVTTLGSASFGPSRPCASFSIDAHAHRVNLIAIPDARR